MNMFDDEEDYGEAFYEWLDDNDHYFTWEMIEDSMPKIAQFYQTVYLGVMPVLTVAIRNLMYEQYPVMQKEKRPSVIKKIEENVLDTSTSFLINLFCLLLDEQNGVNLRDKHKNFELWMKLYATPSKTYGVGEEDFPNMPWLTEEEKQEIIEMNKTEYFYMVNWKEKRRKAFIRLLQEVMLEHYRQFLNLTPDGWIVYSAKVNHIYADYKNKGDFIHNFILSELPEKDLHLSDDELKKKFNIIFKEKEEKKQTPEK